MTRSIDIRITAARDQGFTAWEGGEVIAAFESAASAAIWLENRLRQVDGVHARDDEPHTVEVFPNVFNASETVRKRGGLLGRLKNG